MALADTIVDYSLAAMLLTWALSLAIFLGSILFMFLENKVHNYVIRRKARKIPIGGPIQLKDGRKPTAADFLLIKVHIMGTQPLQLDVDLDVKGRENIIGLACPICSKDLGDVDKPSLTVMAHCFHIFHTDCTKKFRHRNICPSCSRAVDSKDMKEVEIISKPYNCEDNSGNAKVA